MRLIDSSDDSNDGDSNVNVELFMVVSEKLSGMAIKGQCEIRWSG